MLSLGGRGIRWQGWAGGSRPSRAKGEPGGKGLGEQPHKTGTGCLLQERACGTVWTSLWDRQAGQQKEQHSNRATTLRACEACQLQSKASTSSKDMLFPPRPVGWQGQKSYRYCAFCKGWKTGHLLDATLPRRTCTPQKSKRSFLPRSVTWHGQHHEKQELVWMGWILELRLRRGRARTITMNWLTRNSHLRRTHANTFHRKKANSLESRMWHLGHLLPNLTMRACTSERRIAKTAAEQQRTAQRVSFTKRPSLVPESTKPLGDDRTSRGQRTVRAKPGRGRANHKSCLSHFRCWNTSANPLGQMTSSWERQHL